MERDPANPAFRLPAATFNAGDPGRAITYTAAFDCANLARDGARLVNAVGGTANDVDPGGATQRKTADAFDGKSTAAPITKTVWFGSVPGQFTVKPLARSMTPI